MFTLFESRKAIYGVAYLTSVYTRDDVYQNFLGYDVAKWLHENRKPTDPVALHQVGIRPYSLRC